MNYRQFANTAKAEARDKLESVEAPNGDPLPHAVLEAGTGGIVYLAIDPSFFSGRIAKRALIQFHILPAIAEHQARKVAMVNGMVSLRPGSPGFELVTRIARNARQPNDPEGVPNFMELEGHVEQLSVSVFDAERHELWLAEIVRSAISGPTLGEWTLAGGEPDQITGAWVDPIKAALR